MTSRLPGPLWLRSRRLIQPVALVAVRGAELSVHTLGRGAAFTHTVEKMPDLVGKSLDKLFEAWAARKRKRKAKLLP
jgi:hypothetical protein